MNETRAVQSLGALAQETRLRIFRALVAQGLSGLTPGHLSESLGVAGTALSFHLKELSQAGLVSQERDGRHLIYRAEFGTMSELLQFLTAHCCQGEPCEVTPPVSLSVSLSPIAERPVMSSLAYNVLFICTGNSARSIMAETILNHQGAGRFRAYSAGSHPAGAVNPHAIELLTRNRFKTDGLRSKNWSEFAQPDAPKMDFVLTVCDKAAGEMCPIWPGQPMSAHWGVEDPAAAQGSEQDIQRAFSDCFMVMSRRIALLTVLPIDKLDRLALKNELDTLGRVNA